MGETTLQPSTMAFGDDPIFPKRMVNVGGHAPHPTLSHRGKCWPLHNKKPANLLRSIIPCQSGEKDLQKLVIPSLTPKTTPLQAYFRLARSLISRSGLAAISHIFRCAPGEQISFFENRPVLSRGVCDPSPPYGLHRGHFPALRPLLRALL